MVKHKPALIKEFNKKTVSHLLKVYLYRGVQLHA